MTLEVSGLDEKAKGFLKKKVYLWLLFITVSHQPSVMLLFITVSHHPSWIQLLISSLLIILFIHLFILFVS